VGRPFVRPGEERDPSGWDLIARSIADYHGGEEDAAVTLLSDAEDERHLPASHFFRSGEEIPALERVAMERARGRVLDVGAGAGAHALYLQDLGHAVTAFEVAEHAVRVMQDRGVADVRRVDMLSDPDDQTPGEETWDTILLLMNGTTLVGSVAGLTSLLSAAVARLAPGGRILLDSTDVREDEGAPVRDDGRYVGEVQLQVAYKGMRSQPFSVLFADPEVLAAAASAVDLTARVIVFGDDGAYLAELTRP
jgi:SAM-dependent methyltransferase